jgi:PAS domain-containing protein
MLEVRLLHAPRAATTRCWSTVRERTAELQRFRGAMDATADAIFLVDVQGMALDVNDGACRMLGYARGELLSLAPGALLPSPPPAPLAAAGRFGPPGHGSDGMRTGAARPGPGARGAGTGMQSPVAGEPATGGLLLIAVARDISERRQAQERLKHLAHYDGLTGLPNRSLFFQTWPRPSSWRRKSWRIVVLFIALDRFKSINDTLGAALGDELLRQFSNRLVECVRLRDTVGRLGGDELR